MANGALSTLPMGALMGGGMMDPQAAMLTQMGLGLMAASGPSRTPVTLGQGLGQAGMQGMQAYQQANQANQQQQLFALKMTEAQREIEERKKKEAAAAQFKAQFPHLAPLLDVAPNIAAQRAFPESKEPRTETDAQGVRRFVDGPNAGQVVPGFDTQRAPEGFRYEGGKLVPIAEYWNKKREVAEAGRPSTTLNNFPNPIPVTKPDGSVVLVQFGNKGEVRETPYTPAPAAPTPPADAERTAAGYAARMEAAERALQEIGPAGYQTMGTDAAAKVPLVGAYAERAAMTPEQQQVRQAQRDWVRAKLRKESGAVIGKEEEDNEIATYFPQPGDGPEVIAQKERARQTAMEAMVQSAGRAAPKSETKPKIIPKSKQFKLDNGSAVIGKLEESTGKYYVVRNGRKFYIEE